MNYFPKPASRTLVSLALTSTILTGCGSDSSDLSFGNTGGQNAPLAMPVVSGLPGQLSGKLGTITIGVRRGGGGGGGGLIRLIGPGAAGVPGLSFVVNGGAGGGATTPSVSAVAPISGGPSGGFGGSGGFGDGAVYTPASAGGTGQVIPTNVANPSGLFF